MDNFLLKIARCAGVSNGEVHPVDILRSDGGPDFGSHDFEQVLDKYNILHEHIPTDNSEQNCIVERRIGIIGERVCT